jgi:hypothetical protein
MPLFSIVHYFSYSAIMSPGTCLLAFPLQGRIQVSWGPFYEMEYKIVNESKVYLGSLPGPSKGPVQVRGQGLSMVIPPLGMNRSPDP